ncbi:hypothetical protein E5K00_18560 [Hymenobacter aquaticus]|uniref:Endonuclease GajA/Old nuclease/RecF-like AAA domain-containing protein n=1 Tax=Hymenobacter aquaticus TaxID=1867101 RepID=A0A4Z0PWV2_9BACT|nr:AAA family ATPase [Hymenobacter aquaticus]TGE22250.1 hypothetical protein E5K00_18560 [Hymenobacter aquaticus]
MVEKLIIQNFAGLNLEIELGEITIFIGPQASGKSICARCIYWFKSFLSRLEISINNNEDKRKFDESCLRNFKEYFSSIVSTTREFHIHYQIGKLSIKLTQTNNKLKIIYSPLIQAASNKFRVRTNKIKNKYSSSKFRPNNILRYQQVQEFTEARTAWAMEIWSLADGNPIRNQAFVLAGRSIFSALQGSILTFLSNNTLKDPLMRDFLREYEYARQDQPQPTNPLLKSIIPLVESILKGQLLTQKDDNYLILSDGRKISLTDASSGQQEAFPLILFLLSYLDDSRNGFLGPHMLYIEEPEAHIFPESQRVMAQLMTNIYNETEDLKYIITTHSPYLLSSFNNLIYAHQLAERLQDQPNELKKLYKIVPKSQQVPLSDFRVYGLENGKAISLIDHELGLISASLLDSASDVTAEQFGDLMALDPTTQA